LGALASLPARCVIPDIAGKDAVLVFSKAIFPRKADERRGRTQRLSAFGNKSACKKNWADSPYAMKTPNLISNPHVRSCPSRFFSLSSLMAGLCLTVGTVLGAGEPAKQEAKQKVKLQQKSKSASEEKVLITGSLIPQKVKPNRIPVTASSVIIIGQKDIERSGASTVAEVLRRQGASR
jgi:hypothetical protein